MYTRLHCTILPRRTRAIIQATYQDAKSDLGVSVGTTFEQLSTTMSNCGLRHAICACGQCFRPVFVMCSISSAKPHRDAQASWLIYQQRLSALRKPLMRCYYHHHAVHMRRAKLIRRLLPCAGGRDSCSTYSRREQYLRGRKGGSPASRG